MKTCAKTSTLWSFKLVSISDVVWCSQLFASCTRPLLAPGACLSVMASGGSPPWVGLRAHHRSLAGARVPTVVHTTRVG